MCLHTSFFFIWTARIPFVQNWRRALAKAVSHTWEGVQRKRLIITKTFRARSKKNVHASLVEIVCVRICWYHLKCCRVWFIYSSIWVRNVQSDCSTPATAQHWMMASRAVMSLQNKRTYHILWPFLPPVSAGESLGPAKPIERQSNEREW